MALKVKNLADGFAEYQTMDGDLVDKIAFDFYGTHEGTTETVYDDNPHLLKLDMILPAGITVRLRPRAPAPPTRGQINLWD